jgi:hypothetical protein
VLITPHRKASHSEIFAFFRNDRFSRKSGRSSRSTARLRRYLYQSTKPPVLRLRAAKSSSSFSAMTLICVASANATHTPSS